MEVLCINIANSKKEKINVTNLKLQKDCDDFVEVTIPLNMLNKRVFEYERNLKGKVQGFFFDRKLLSCIKSKEKERIYILPKTFDNIADKNTAINSMKEYVEKITKKAGYEYYTYIGNIKANIYKYINEKLDKLEKPYEQAKILFIYLNYSNIDYNILSESIEKFKSVDIYCKDYDNKVFNNKIDEINKNYGTSIAIKNKMLKKDFKVGNYDLVVYMDKGSTDIQSYNSCKIDLSDDDNDKFDKAALFMNENKLYKEINSDYLSYMTKNYGRLKLLSLLSKKFGEA